MNVTERFCLEIEFEGSTYLRWGANCWEKIYGQSTEAMHGEEEEAMEANFQKWNSVYGGYQDVAYTGEVL